MSYEALGSLPKISTCLLGDLEGVFLLCLSSTSVKRDIHCTCLLYREIRIKRYGGYHNGPLRSNVCFVHFALDSKTNNGIRKIHQTSKENIEC